MNLTSQHLDACISINDLCCSDYKLLILEYLVQEPNCSDFTISNTTDKVNQYSLLSALIHNQTATLLLGEEFSLVLREFLWPWESFQFYEEN